MNDFELDQESLNSMKKLRRRIEEFLRQADLKTLIIIADYLDIHVRHRLRKISAVKIVGKHIS